MYSLGNGYFASIVYSQEELLHLYKIQKDSIIHTASAIKRGNGPFEMGVVDLAYDKKNKELILHDFNTRNALAIELSEPTQINHLDKWKRSDIFSLHP